MQVPVEDQVQSVVYIVQCAVCSVMPVIGTHQKIYRKKTDMDGFHFWMLNFTFLIIGEAKQNSTWMVILTFSGGSRPYIRN